jgi:hypothetical protein
LILKQILSTNRNRENTDSGEVMKFAGFRTVFEHPQEWDWIRLKFNLDSIEKIFQSIKNVNYNNFGFMVFNVEFIAVNVRYIGDVYLKKIIRDIEPDSGIWIKYFISIQHKKSRLYPDNQDDDNFFQKIGIKDHRIISVNLGDYPDKLLQELYDINIDINQYNKKVDQVLKEAKWNQGKGKSPFHDWIERNVPGWDTLPQDWKTTPGIILMKGSGDLYFLPLRKLFDTVWNEYYFHKEQYISVVGRQIINEIIQSLNIYNDVMIKGLNYSNIVSFNNNIDWNCSRHQDEREINFDKDNFLQLVDQDLLTEIVYDFTEEYLNPEKIPDWRLRDEFFKNIYNYMMERNHPLFQNEDYHKAINNCEIWNSKNNHFKNMFYSNILNNFDEFLETRLKEQSVLESKGIRQAIIQELLYYRDEEDYRYKKERNRVIFSERYTIWNCYGNTNQGLYLLIDGKLREFRTGMNIQELNSILNIIINYWSNNWKRKELIGEEFFLINQLRGESGEEINNRREFDLVVIENYLISSNHRPPFYLIKMIDQKDNRMYSVRVDISYKSIIHQISKDVRGGRINKYKFAALATPGTRVLLKAQVKKVYQDTVYFVPNNRLNRVHSIKLLNLER